VIILASALVAVFIESNPFRQQTRALANMVASWSDNEFNISIAEPQAKELYALTQQLNGVANRLRRERQTLAQRELLLQTVIHNNPSSVLLCDAKNNVVLANLSAKRWLKHPGDITGANLSELLAGQPAEVQQAAFSLGDRIISINTDDNSQSLYVSARSFTLNGQAHRLLLIREITQELSRQEVDIWKKVIRLMSHEINNSLAPISSLIHTGKSLVKNNDSSNMDKVFATIEDRAQHLSEFILGYAKFAKLPQPSIKAVDLPRFLEPLCLALGCRWVGETAATANANSSGWYFDQVQIEQVIINLVKNAVEAGSDADAISIRAVRGENTADILVSDAGQGMSEEQMQNALLPFYSTKRSGSGIGLALSREIMEAHGGSLLLAQRLEGGTEITLRFKV
jgi:nitrogen fixation/metabolism regulation signal transduction histidine kinase